MRLDRPSRRQLLTLGSGAGLALALGACAVSPEQTGGGGSTAGTVRFSWWGNASRQELFSEFAVKFQDRVEGATVQLEPSEYSGYVDRLSVQAAGQNLPDVFWMPANLAGTYAARNVLLDLDTLSEGVLDLTDFPAETVESWRLAGAQSGPVYSQYSTCTQFDITALHAVGISDLPDDEGWTWDDLHTIALDYAQAKGEGNWGIANMASFYQHAHLWIRQNGAEVFTEDGAIGLDAAVVGDWFDYWQKGIASGAVMPPEVAAGQNQWTQTANQTALYLVQLNQFQDNQSFSGENELVLRKSPEVPGATDDYQFRYYTRLCVAANTADPELAGRFVNFLLNDEANVTDVGLATGVHSNPRLVAEIAAAGDPVDTKILEISERIDAQPMRPRPEPPVGGSEWQSLIERAADDIFNGGVDITTAVQTGLDSLQEALDRG